MYYIQFSYENPNLNICKWKTLEKFYNHDDLGKYMQRFLGVHYVLRIDQKMGRYASERDLDNFVFGTDLANNSDENITVFQGILEGDEEFLPEFVNYRIVYLADTKIKFRSIYEEFESSEDVCSSF